MKKYLTMTAAVLVILIIINHFTLKQAVELCEESKKDAHIDRDLFAINWSVSCKE
ncbi:hypothetical protein LLY41_11980 [Cytobacillus firmus]|uniref:hypothetical protein n=1 Tax=Cytobacillus firmus TaxID=1399 RepID=UPI0021872E56|nr:hypothetical protein [Cytobacillus firmus]URM31157.1 hypothetical protein LLY41_11980 [Cytobacillus firmus]